MRIIILLKIVLLTQFLSAQPFKEVLPAQPLKGVAYGAVVFGDLDGDADADLIITGEGNSGTLISQVFDNDEKGIFVKENYALKGVRDGAIALADMDGDNDLDALLTGFNSDNQPIARLLFNKFQNSGLLEDNGRDLIEGVGYSSVAFRDIDGDNDQDILVAGEDSLGFPVTELYINAGAPGMGHYLPLSGIPGSSPPFKGVSHGAVAFSDIDGDLDPDILITGIDSAQNPTAKFYIKDSTARNYTEKLLTQVEGVSYSAIAFIDVDGDQDEDLIITGINDMGNRIAKLYVNNGLGDFSEKLNTPFEGCSNGAIACQDIDGDLDMDVLITGLNQMGIPISKVYTNDGMGNFVEKTGHSLDNVENGTVTFNDIDGDLDPDLLLTGINQDGTNIAKLYTNDGLGNFKEIRGHPIMLDLTYHAIDEYIELVDVDNDNDPDMFIPHIDQHGAVTTELYLNDGKGNYQKKPGSSIIGVTRGDLAFADVDGDKDLDLMIVGWSNYTGAQRRSDAKLYINDGSGNFTEKTNSSFLGIRNGKVAFADIDGDNDQDMVIVGDRNSMNPSATLYTNDGRGNFTQKSGTSLEGFSYGGDIAFMDIDGDNDSDLLIAGDAYDGFGYKYVYHKYINDGTGSFKQETLHALSDINVISMIKSDVDGDNDEDYFMIGVNTFTHEDHCQLYINNGNGGFGLKTDSIFGGKVEALYVGDIDGDQDNDVLCTKIKNGVAFTSLEINDGNGNYTELPGTSFQVLSENASALADINGDTDLDIIMTGRNFANKSSLIFYINESVTTSIRDIDTHSKVTFQIYPNPNSTGKVYLDFESDIAQEVQISLIDLQGRVLYRQIQSVTHGSNTLQLSYPDITHGMYLLELNDGKQRITRKLLKR